MFEKQVYPKFVNPRGRFIPSFSLLEVPPGGGRGGGGGGGVVVAAAAKNGQRKKPASAISFGISTSAFFQFDAQLLLEPLQDKRIQVHHKKLPR